MAAPSRATSRTASRAVGRSGAPPSAPAAALSAPVPQAALELVGRACTGLVEASAASDPAERFVLSHLAALRAGAAVVATREVPRARRRGPVSVWDALLVLAPELEGWARVFGSAAERRAAVEAGRGAPVGAREADEHLDRAEVFASAVADLLGARPPARVLPLAAS